MSARQGLLICFCGIDGSGKSTHIRFVYQHLKRMRVKVKSSTLVTRKGDFFRALQPIIDHVSIQLYCDLFAFQRYRAIKSRLANELLRYDVVLCDRYLYTDLAYTTGYDQTTDLMVLLLEQVPKPDLTLLLDTPAEVAMDRIIHRKKGVWSRQENLALLSRTRQAYLAIAEEKGFIVIDTTVSLEQSVRIAISHVNNLLVR